MNNLVSLHDLFNHKKGFSQPLDEEKSSVEFRSEIAQRFIAAFSPIYFNRTLWIYAEETGNYFLCSTDHANAIIEELVGDHARNSNALCNDVLGEIYRCCYREPDSIFNQKRHLVNFSNCTLNLRDGSTMEHDPDFVFSYHLRAKYKPIKQKKLNHSRFYSFVSEMCGYNSQKYLRLQEMCGVLLSDIKIKGSIFFIGDHDTGKSVLGNLIAAALGPENVSSLALSELRAEFLVSQIYGKKLNVSGEMQKDISAKDWRLFKTITGGDKLMLNGKFQQPFSAELTAKFLFIGNFLPTFPEDDPALLDRCNVIHFNNIIARKDRDPDLLEKLKKELHIFIRWAMEGAMRYLEQGGFTYCPESEKYFQNHVRKCDSITWFIEEKLCAGEGSDIIPTADIYNSYKMFCEDFDAPILPAQRLLEMIGKAFPSARRTRIYIGTSRPRVITGIRYKE